MDEAITGERPEYAKAVIHVRPSNAQLERLQAMCQWGATYSQIAECLGVAPALLRWWARQDDEAGDALRVTRAIRRARADLKV